MENTMTSKTDIGRFKDFIKEEDGMGVVEVILIIVVLISLVIIFRDGIQAVTKNIMNRVKSGSNTINYN